MGKSVTALALAGLLATHPVTEPFAGRVPAYVAEIDKCVVQHGLHPVEVLTVILQESGGNPNSYNPRSGATGLMNVMPSDTPILEYRPVFADRPTSEQLKDPATNLAIGCPILKDRLNRAHGDFKWAMFYYSGGDTHDPQGERNRERAFTRYVKDYWPEYEKFWGAMIDTIIVNVN